MDHIDNYARLRKMDEKAFTILLNSGLYAYFLEMKMDVGYTVDKQTKVCVLFLALPKTNLNKSIKNPNRIKVSAMVLRYTFFLEMKIDVGYTVDKSVCVLFLALPKTNLNKSLKKKERNKVSAMVLSYA